MRTKKRFIRLVTALVVVAVMGFPLLSPTPALAAATPVYVNHTLQTYTTTQSNPVSFSHTVPAAGINHLLVVAVMIEADESVTAIEYDGVSLTRATYEDGGGSNEMRVEIWYLVNPTTGSSETVAVHPDGSGTDFDDFSAIAAVSFTGVDQTSPIGATDGSNGNTTNPSTTITTQNADSLIFGALAAYGGDTDPFTPGGSISEKWDADTGSDSSNEEGVWGATLDSPTPQLYTFNATMSASDDWSIAAIEINPPCDPYVGPPNYVAPYTLKTYSSDQDDPSFSHTVPAAGTNHLLVVVVMIRGDESVTGITYDGVSLTKAIHQSPMNSQ